MCLQLSSWLCSRVSFILGLLQQHQQLVSQPPAIVVTEGTKRAPSHTASPWRGRVGVGVSMF